MMIVPGDTVQIVGPTVGNDIELLGMFCKISEKTLVGNFMVEGDTFRCFPRSSLKLCEKPEIQPTYNKIQEELTEIKKMLVGISDKMDKLSANCTTSKGVLKVGDCVQYVADEKTRIHKLKLALLREGGDCRMDDAKRISYLVYKYPDIMVPEDGISKEDDLRNMLVELTYYPEFIEEIIEEVYGGN